MSARINQPGSSGQASGVNRASQPAQQAQKNQAQPEARSSYTFQDSRHVVKGGGIAAVSLELTIEAETAENVELLGFEQGDQLTLEGMGPVHGSAFIKTLTQDNLELQFKFIVPQMSRRAAAMAFERLSKLPYQLQADGQVNLTASIARDGKGGYSYALIDNHHNKLLMAAPLDLRLDNFSARNILHQIQTYIVDSGNTISFAIEKAPDQAPTAKLKVSQAPGIGDFDVTKQERP